MIWTAPTELPDLRRVGIIAIDTETNDEGLRADRGSAWPWRGGYICGISVAWRDDSGIRGNYFPLRHPDSENFERETVARWLKDHIAAGVRIVTQNGLYDWGWLRADLRHRHAAVRSARRGRRARDPGRRESIQILPRRALQALRFARQGRRRCCSEAVEAPGSKGRRRSTPAESHLAFAGALCRPVCRDRSRCHARSCTSV